MPVDKRIKAILRSAELVFELGVVNATRYGPVIHANVPDYAEILLRVFADDNSVANHSTLDFPKLVTAARAFVSATNWGQFDDITDYYKNARTTFRNPLHHTDRVQGYVIEQREVLTCLLKFDELLTTLFPTLNPITFEDLNFPGYVRFLRMQYDESLGRGDHRLYRAVVEELGRLEKEDNYTCPSEFDASHLIAVRRLFRLDQYQFQRTVLKFRPTIEIKIVGILESKQKALTARQIYTALTDDPDLPGLQMQEVESCLEFVAGKPSPNYVTVLRRDMRYLLVPS